MIRYAPSSLVIEGDQPIGIIPYAFETAVRLTAGPRSIRTIVARHRTNQVDARWTAVGERVCLIMPAEAVGFARDGVLGIDDAAFSFCEAIPAGASRTPVGSPSAEPFLVDVPADTSRVKFTGQVAHGQGP